MTQKIMYGGKKLKTKKTVLTLVVLLCLLSIPLLNVRAATEGSSDGTLTIGNIAPDITSVTFAQDNTAIDVDTTYTVTASITDDNKLSNLDNVTYILWDSVTTTEGGADDETDHYTFLYDEDLDAWEEIGPDSAGDSHLVIGSCSDPADHEQTSGDFTLGFKLHKTANKESVTTSWKIKIIVYDEPEDSDSDQTKTFGVSFYLEITVDDTTHAWTTATLGSNDNPLDSPVDGDIDLTVTANAAFDLQAKGSGDLDNAGEKVGLGNVTIHKDTLGSSVSLTTTYADIGGLTGLTAGESLAHSFMLWIDVPSGLSSGDYTYTLWVQGLEA